MGYEDEKLLRSGGSVLVVPQKTARIARFLICSLDITQQSNHRQNIFHLDP